MAFTKLWSSIVHSTIWREDLHVKVVWITMLALADRNGYIAASIPGLADLSRVTLDECLEALLKLQAPDKWSRTQDHEGRRIETADGGWKILNFLKFREPRDDEERRIQNRENVAAFRARKKAAGVSRVSESARVSQGKHGSASPEADPDPEKDNPPNPLPPAPASPPPAKGAPDCFFSIPEEIPTAPALESVLDALPDGTRRLAFRGKPTGTGWKAPNNGGPCANVLVDSGAEPGAPERICGRAYSEHVPPPPGQRGLRCPETGCGWYCPPAGPPSPPQTAAVAFAEFKKLLRRHRVSKLPDSLADTELELGKLLPALADSPHDADARESLRRAGLDPDALARLANPTPDPPPLLDPVP